MIRPPLLFAAACLPLSNACAGVCPSPPVVTQNQALCLARNLVESPRPPWQVDYRVFKATKGWSVRFEPRARADGTRGELFIDTQSGRVSIIRIDR